MNNRLSRATLALLFVALTLPIFVFAQQGQLPRAPNTGNAPAASPFDSSRRSPSSATAARTGSNARARRETSDATAGIEKDFSEALTIVEENYVGGKKLDYNAIFKQSIIGMLRTLDPHSNYYDREEFDELKTDQRSEYYGIGASIGDRKINDKTDTYVLATFEGSPAAAAGLRFGDRIAAVNGEEMRGRDSGTVRDKIRGPSGSTVKITIEPAAAPGTTKVVEITRKAVPQPSIPDAYMLKPGVGYIDMTHGFNYTTANELQAALEYLHGKGMTSLVLDLRGNPGGILQQAVHAPFLRQDHLPAR